MGAHRDIKLTDEERTAALVGYLFVCIAWACLPPDERPDYGFYEYCTRASYRGRGNFGSAVCWAMRAEDQQRGGTTEGWLSYVEHVVGYRCGPGNGHEARS